MKKSLRTCTDEELKQELERRAKSRLFEPVARAMMDFGPLARLIQQEIASAYEVGYLSKDFKQYVYETALIAVYGPTIFKKLNADDVLGE